MDADSVDDNDVRAAVVGGARPLPFRRISRHRALTIDDWMESSEGRSIYTTDGSAPIVPRSDSRYSVLSTFAR